MSIFGRLRKKFADKVRKFRGPAFRLPYGSYAAMTMGAAQRSIRTFDEVVKYIETRGWACQDVISDSYVCEGR